MPNEREATVEPLLYTPDQTGQVLGVARTTVYELMKSGDLEFVVLGSRRKVLVASVKAYVASLASGVDAAPAPARASA